MSKQYRLGSAEFVGAPGVVAWAKSGYAFPDDQEKLRDVIAQTWSIPDEAAHALLSGESPYHLEDGEHGKTVVFEVDDDQTENQQLDHDRHNLLSGVMDNR
jgi:hypothetical protein